MVKKIFILFALFITFNPELNSAYAENNSVSGNQSSVSPGFNLAGDVLYRTAPAGGIKLFDKVLAAVFDRDKGTLYYIRSSEDRWIAGLLKESSNEAIEFKIPWKYEKLYKFSVSNDIFYYLADPFKENTDEKYAAGPVYVRFNPDKSASQSIEGVTDFFLLNGKSVLLRNNLLDYNGLQIPLTLTGNLKISDIIDSRIAFISGDEGGEVVDLTAEKSIYQYKGDSVPEYSEEYNIILEFEDKFVKNETPTGIENSVYYEIRIDGVEENRTGAGRGELVKVFQSILSPGDYHIIKAERWELDQVKGRYTRMNNVYQPSELKIFIPENRIIKIKIEFNGTGYRINQSVLFE